MPWITFHSAKYFSTILSVVLRLFIKNGSHRWRASCMWTVNFKWLQEMEFHNIKDALSSLRNFWKLKLFSFSYLNVCFEFSVMSKNGLIRAIRLISKFMTLEPVHKQLEHTYWPISREEKIIRQMRFGQIIGRKMKYFFLKNHTQNTMEILFPDPFLKNQNSEVSCSLLLWHVELKSIRTYWN